MLPQNVPEGPALTPHLDDRPAERDAILAELEHTFTLVHPRGGEFRHVRMQVPIEKVEHGVARRIHAGREGRPCHRRERRERGAQAVEAALFAQAAQVGQFALRHVALGQRWIQPVQSEKDQFFDLCALISLVSGDCADGHAEGPKQSRDQAQQDSKEQGEERPDKREPGAGPDIRKFRRDGKVHLNFPSTKGTSKTFLCMIGPWPK